MKAKWAGITCFAMAIVFSVSPMTRAQPQFTNAQIHVSDIQEAEVNFCVTPDTDNSLLGKFIIKPRCDNINLVLRCPLGGNEKKSANIIKPIPLVEKPIGIQCPPATPCNDDDPSCRDDHIDVIQVLGPSPLCVTCALPRRFDLSPGSLGLVNGRHEGKVVQCSLEAMYSTKGITDPVDPISPYRPVTVNEGDYDVNVDWCRNQQTSGDTLGGTISLEPVEQILNPQSVCLEFPIGWGINKSPWLKECSPTVFAPPHIPAMPFQGADHDGYSDTTEQNGFTLNNQMELAGGTHPNGTATNIPACLNTTDTDREYCVHDGTQDLFAVIRPLDSSSSSSSFFPSLQSATQLADFFATITAPYSSTAPSGLGIAVHPLKQPLPPPGQDDYSRVVADGQNAARIREKDDPLPDVPPEKDTPIDLAQASPGTLPNTGGEIAIYTNRIKQYVCDLCGGTPAYSGTCYPADNYDTSNCKNSYTGNNGDELVKDWARYANHHEIGHALGLVDPLVDPDAAFYNGHHAPGETYKFMTPLVTFTKRGSKVTFHIPNGFCPSCGFNRKLN